jgi:hypothetical protein
MEPARGFADILFMLDGCEGGCVQMRPVHMPALALAHYPD